MLRKRILNVWKNYFTSQFLVTMFVFALNWLAGGLTGLRFAFLNALAAGICEVIPNVGPFISCVISAALALAFGSSKLDIANWQYALIIVGCSILIQALQNWLISPLIVGKKMDLHPVVVFLGMIVFSYFFGFWGMILAVPIMASFKEVKKYSGEQKNTGEQISSAESKKPEPDKLQEVLPPKDEKI